MGTGKRKKDHEDDTSTEPPEVDEEGEGPSAPKKRKIEPEEPVLEAASKNDSKDNAVQDESEKLQLLVSAFSNSQQDQYEIFRRSTFPKAAIKKIMQSVSGVSVPQNAAIAMAGITKVYVGELVEEACQARETMREEGPLQPKHIREAVRKLKNNNKIPNSRYKKVFPFR